MKNIFIIAIIILISLITGSCKKEKPTHFDMKQLSDCSASQNYDSTKLASKLIGSWKWTEYSGEVSGKQFANKDVKVTFTSVGTFTVTENSMVITQGKWELGIVDWNSLGLTLDKPSAYLYGRILLCQNQLLFNNSYIDGGDNLFVRTN